MYMYIYIYVCVCVCVYVHTHLLFQLSRTKEQFSKCKQDLEEEQYKSEGRILSVYIGSASGSSATHCLQSLFSSTATFQNKMQLNVNIKNTGPATV